MREIKVSVIIPIYNVEEYLEECLQSVVDQTLEDLQVIMVDDGSLDGSTDIAKKFASRYDHFEYVRQVNGGLGNARNTGVKYAKGKYIIFLDSDDIVPDDAYEKMYLAAEKNHSEMVVLRDLTQRKTIYRICMKLHLENISIKHILQTIRI
jgi:CDP-glycerol glycerophosphotransferase